MTAAESSMLNELLNDDSDRLSEWEIEFIESLDHQRERNLTEKQADKLQKIWDRVFA